MGMYRWMGSHFHDWIDCHRVPLSIESLEWGRIFSDFWGKTADVMFTARKHTRMFALWLKMLRQCFFSIYGIIYLISINLL